MPSEPSSHASASSPAPSPSWAPPRAPLPPHRLAKIANALGVSTPSPAMSSSPSLSTFASPNPTSSSPSTSSDNQWRSPTPSAMSNANFSTYPSTPQSKYLLHIIPPRHLAKVLIEGSDDEDGSLASSHVQFRRGALVPFQHTMQAQLVLIAKEYSLPSTFGIILYLVSSKPTRVQPSFLKPPDSGDGDADPGPRLSEDVWRHMWARAMKAEQEESLSNVTSPISPSPSLGMPMKSPNALRPLVTPFRSETPQLFGPTLAVTPSPSTTASSISDFRSHTKSAPPSSSSPAQSEPETPDTSEHDGQGLDLPGLHSDAFVPVLAKVEFDIDRHKAKWYNQWRRNRRMTASRAPSRQQTGDSASGDERKAPFSLKLVGKHQNDSIPSFLREKEDDDSQADEYAPLSDSPTYEEASTARGTILYGGDPLADVFGSDADTWADMHADAPERRREQNPNVVPLALDANALEAVDNGYDYSGSEADEVAEVRDIMKRMSQTSDVLISPYSPRKSGAFSLRRGAPPPIVIAPKSPNRDIALGVSPVPSNSDESAMLAYTMDDGTPMGPEMLDKGSLSENRRSRSSQEEKEKRDGVIYDDLDLGLDIDENDLEAHYDENDPNDRRRSQYVMKARLDEIERAMAQFSPKTRKSDRLGDDLLQARSPKPSPLRNVNVPLSAPPARTDSLRDQQSTRPASSQDKAWGASITHSPGPSSTLSPRPPSKSLKLSPSPSRLGLNGVPRPSLPSSRSSPSLSSDSESRRKDVNVDAPPPLPPSLTRKAMPISPPVIPLSPDPFGRGPSFQEQAEIIHQSYWDPATGQLSQRPSISSFDDGTTMESSAANSSRFSADSSTYVDDTPNAAKGHRTSGSIVTMKGFKKLWRKSRTQSVSGQQTPPVPNIRRDSLQPPLPPPISRSSSDQSRSSSRSANHTPPPVPFPSSGGFQSYDPFRNEQEGAIPTRLTNGRKPTGSGRSSPANTLDMFGPLPELPDKTGSGGRKSILKWKGSMSHQSTGSEYRPLSTDTVKPHRPSIMGNSFVPPSPRLPPEFYAGASLPDGHARNGSGFPERLTSIQPLKIGLDAGGEHVPRPSQSSQLSVSSHPRSPPGSILSSRSQDSEGARSFELTQFEMVSHQNA